MRKRRATLNKLILFAFLMNFVECVLVMTLTKPGCEILIFEFKKLILQHF